MGPRSLHRLLMRSALAAAHVFAWVFIFHYYYSTRHGVLPALVSVVLAYALTHTIVVLSTPFTPRMLRNGVRRMLVRGACALAAAFALLAAAFSGVFVSLEVGIAGFAILLGAYRALYWMPYEVVAKNKARNFETLVAFAPLIAGLFIAVSAYAAVGVLVSAAALALIAIVPLFALKDVHEAYAWGYRETFHELFAPQRRVPFLQAICNGFEGAGLLLLWPIVIFMLIGWSYSLLGIILTLTFLATWGVKKLMRRLSMTMSPVVHSIFTVSAWVLRGTIAAPFAIIVVDTCFNSGAGATSRGIDAMTFEQSADNHTFVDELTALKEMGQAMGRILFCLLLIALASASSYPVVVLGMFACAALSAIFSILLSRRTARVAY